MLKRKRMVDVRNKGKGSKTGEGKNEKRYREGDKKNVEGKQRREEKENETKEEKKMRGWRRNEGG